MSNAFNVNSKTISTTPLNDWLLWHEAGHNFASVPFNVTGSTEVTNNILALYMQELDGRGTSLKMNRIETSIQRLGGNDGHVWSNGDADQGWNLFKLMHRKARGGDEISPNGIEINYCSAAESGLSNGDLLMACASYTTGYDLSDFFNTWNVGEISMTTPDKNKVYSGGITDKGRNAVRSMGFDKPKISPLTINSL